VRLQIATHPGVRSVCELEVHAESSQTRLLHIHASLDMPQGVTVREALVTMRALKAALARSQFPVFNPTGQPVRALPAATGGGSGNGSEGGGAGGAGPDRWTVSQVDLRFELNPL
jgi:hypothetical protein